jgi:hypothetical protein
MKQLCKMEISIAYDGGDWIISKYKILSCVTD